MRRGFLHGFYSDARSQIAGSTTLPIARNLLLTYIYIYTTTLAGNLVLLESQVLRCRHVVHKRCQIDHANAHMK